MLYIKEHIVSILQYIELSFRLQYHLDLLMQNCYKDKVQRIRI